MLICAMHKKSLSVVKKDDTMVKKNFAGQTRMPCVIGGTMSKKKKEIMIAVSVVAITLIACLPMGCKGSGSGNHGGNNTQQGSNNTDDKDNSGNGLTVDPAEGTEDSIDFNDILNGSTDSDTNGGADSNSNADSNSGSGGGLEAGDNPDGTTASGNTGDNGSSENSPNVSDDTETGYGPLF